jgi:hypothetical protein
MKLDSKTTVDRLTTANKVLATMGNWEKTA